MLQKRNWKTEAIEISGALHNKESNWNKFSFIIGFLVNEGFFGIEKLKLEFSFEIVFPKNAQDFVFR